VPTATVQRQSAPNNGGAGRVQQAVNLKELRDVYVPIQLLNRKMSALLDTGCDTSIVGARLLLAGTHIEPTLHTLKAANGTPIPVEGVVKVTFKIGAQEHSVHAVVTKAIHEMILGIDFLIDADVDWKFSQGRIKLGDEWIKLHTRKNSDDVRKVYVSDDCEIPPGVRVEIPVEISRPTLCIGSDLWATDPVEIDEGVVAARTLFEAKTFQSIVQVINLTEEIYHVRKEQFFGTAERVEVFELGPQRTKSGKGLNVKTVRQTSFSEDAEKQGVEHIECLFNELPKELSEKEKARAQEFLTSNADVFSRGEFDIGQTHLLEHRIETNLNRPVRQALRRHPVAYLPQIDEYVQEMQDNGVVEPRIGSEWVSNIVLVRKKDGTLRYCIDYRGLNAVTTKANYPLPRIDACHDSLGGNTYFSSLDMRSGYWQVPVREEDIDKTCFVTRKGIFGFRVLPFGLCNAPSTFHRLVDMALAGLTWEICLAYLDDLIIFSRTFDQHIERLQRVFDRLVQAGLKLKPSKCALFQRRVKFLGSIMSGEGIEPDPEKVQAVAQWPTPQNVTEVRAFVALASYYRRHIRSFAELTKKDVRFYWGSSQEKAFNMLKEALTSAPVLDMPLDEGQYVLDTDASDFSMGCVLQQWQGGELKVIGYASRAFSEAETKYCTTRKELAAVMFGLKYYRHFLLGAKFVLRTDHAALTYLKRTPHPVSQSARYLNTLEEYNYEVQYRPGDLHRNVDALSRHPCHRNAKPPWCTKCGPILDPADQLMESESKGKRVSERQARPDCERAQVETESELGIIGSMLRADAPIFVPKDTSKLSVGTSGNRRAKGAPGGPDDRRRDRLCGPSARNA